MDFSIIDELFEIYKNEDIVTAQEEFVNYRKNYEKHGKDSLINIINDYIQQQTNSVSNYFKSNKDKVLIEHNIVKDIITCFDNILTSVDFYIGDLLNRDNNNIYDNQDREFKPHNLFNIKIDTIEEAVKKYNDCFIDDFYKIKNFIVYVKDNKILKKLYKDGSWYEIDFEELIYNLYDYIKDKGIFITNTTPSYQKNDFLFEKIKANCAQLLGGSFDKFRPNLNSTKQIRTDFGKLIFCRNLLQFYKTGIMPDNNGFVDFTVDFYENLELIDRFNRLYSKNFNEDKFKENQSNYICNPEIYNTNYELEAKKIVVTGKKLIAGYIISCSNYLKINQCKYLIHIGIEDIDNLNSKYELQISIIPNGKINQRLQLMRIDNWEKEQPHKNIANKLITKTHVHLYNEFDLLRGKTNGGFDIAYNLEGEGVDFETSLKKFLAILDFDKDITNTINNTILESLGTRTELEI